MKNKKEAKRLKRIEKLKSRLTKEERAKFDLEAPDVIREANVFTGGGNQFCQMLATLLFPLAQKMGEPWGMKMYSKITGAFLTVYTPDASEVFVKLMRDLLDSFDKPDLPKPSAN